MSLSSPLQDAGWRAVERVLPKGWRQLAVQMGVIKPHLPAQLGAKIKDAGVLLRLIFNYVATESSLQLTTGAAKGAQVADVSHVALHLRMRKAGPYLAELYSRLIASREVFAPERWAGYELLGTDTTSINGPGKRGVVARVHHALRLSDLQAQHLELTSRCEGESLRRFDVKPRQLLIADRGFCRPPGIAYVVDRGGDVLVRHHRKSVPLFDSQGNAVDLDRVLEGVKARLKPIELDAWVHADDHAPIACRVIVTRIAEDQVEKAQRRVREYYRKRQRKLPAKAYWRAEFVVLLTTVPKENLTTQELVELYRLRWQVELRIKRDKSIGGLRDPPTTRADTTFTWLMAKMLSLELAERLAGRTFSP